MCICMDWRVFLQKEISHDNTFQLTERLEMNHGKFPQGGRKHGREQAGQLTITYHNNKQQRIIGVWGLPGPGHLIALLPIIEVTLQGKSQGTLVIQGGKTFCASFCASLIAGSRRLFCVLTMCWLCLFVAGVLREMHKVRTFAPLKHFYLKCLLFFLLLKITLDSEQPMLKEKRIIPSVWSGIKGFKHFLRGEYFSDCASD